MIRICIIINTYYLYIAKDQYRKSIKKLIRNIYLGFIYKIFTLLSTNYIFIVIIYPLDFLRIISQCLPEKVDATKLTSKMDWTSEALRHHAWDSDWDWGPAFSGSLCGLGSLGSFVRCFFIRGIRILTFFQQRQQQRRVEHLLHFAGSQCSAQFLARTEREQWPRCARVGRHHVATTIASGSSLHPQFPSPCSLIAMRIEALGFLVPLSASFNAANWGKLLGQNWGSDRDGAGEIWTPPAPAPAPAQRFCSCKCPHQVCGFVLCFWASVALRVKLLSFLKSATFVKISVYF